MPIFRPKSSKFIIFGLVPKSPIHIGLISAKNPESNISHLGPFKARNLARHMAADTTADDTLAKRYYRSKHAHYPWHFSGEGTFLPVLLRTADIHTFTTSKLDWSQQVIGTVPSSQANIAHTIPLTANKHRNIYLPLSQIPISVLSFFLTTLWYQWP